MLLITTFYENKILVLQTRRRILGEGEQQYNPVELDSVLVNTSYLFQQFSKIDVSPGRIKLIESRRINKMDSLSLMCEWRSLNLLCICERPRQTDLQIQRGLTYNYSA
jgi:hypothetical protein